MSPIKDRTAIVGIGQSEFAKSLPGSEVQLAAEVIVAALADAGIEPEEVDGLVSFTMETTDEVEIAKNVGMGEVTYFGQIGYGGGAGCATIGHAAMAVASGQCSVAVAWRSRKRGDRSSRPWAAEQQMTVPAEWTRPHGLLRPVDEVAMLTRRYLHETGARREHLANVAIACRRHAQRNPAAMMRDRPLDLETYLASRWISEPLCLFDNCLETDGALAAVIVSAERARDCPHPPAYVHAFAQGLPPQHHGMTNFWSTDPLGAPARAAARRLWSLADIGPADVDVAQIYDAFTPLILFSLEGYGFCEPGDGGPFTEDGNLEWPDGALPVNTSGGGLSEAYVHGFNLVVEGVRQVRGTSTCQVEGAEFSFVTSGEAVPTSALLLRR